MIKIDENKLEINGKKDDIQSQYLIITEEVFKGLHTIDKYVTLLMVMDLICKSIKGDEGDESN